ncbi:MULTISPECIES: GNAT family N-acetyltransferase [unclassified Streptomyces]|uniref:GNAT family N-acetyltransferase n=1 Tax=unclassified Streptomyces TaxID=2593676 RepID=UPI00224E5591|nr:MULTISPECIES: GNAT family N-acetyltransferase [unclassified Streptomyces]MCX5047833.1 GNAT family N-acetyltransferase [Streptomyces sp. NBC_00474]MCX5057464.1 GNAT family N-acetyltransferase [Streptomyces sp. NBC_00452]MCX5245661.1 GNAT family N-acetyltransferase [Streptomyces sp. NBC_00201]MCX5288538.1 GNAT family N-acetyltransferase [Streptomyces sp. NBC_00183]
MDEVTVREMRPEDEPGVAALFASCEDYFVAATGNPALPGDVQSLYYALPDGADFDQKRVLVMCRGERVVGLVDVVDRHPDVESCSVGMFLVAPEARREGLGASVAGRLIEEAAGRGMRTVAATCPGEWEPGLGFLRSLGFEVGAPKAHAGGAMGNRTRRAEETGLCTARLQLADR